VSVIASNILEAASLPQNANRVISNSVAIPVVYGIWLDNHSAPFPTYVGQTLDAERRLWDLPLGESHHLANTYPPEIWQRVVIVRWRDIFEQESGSNLPVPVDVHDHRSIGLGLEYALQTRFRPPMNLWSKARNGSLLEGRPELSQSIGKRVASQPEFQTFYKSIEKIWMNLASEPEDDPGFFRVASGGVAFPSFIFKRLVETG
jgi:hypothetical protein